MAKRAAADPSGGASPARKPWYHEGLAFTCSQCGDCCSGEPGYVWVEDWEISKLAERMAMDVDAFEHKFVRTLGARKSLVEYPDGDCIFLHPESRGCTVYEDRPVQCRTWPFWNSNLASRRTWKETCAVCPGSGTGQVFSLEEIEIRRLERDV